MSYSVFDVATSINCYQNNESPEREEITEISDGQVNEFNMQEEINQSFIYPSPPGHERKSIRYVAHRDSFLLISLLQLNLLLK